MIPRQLHAVSQNGWWKDGITNVVMVRENGKEKEKESVAAADMDWDVLD